MHTILARSKKVAELDLHLLAFERLHEKSSIELASLSDGLLHRSWAFGATGGAMIAGAIGCMLSTSVILPDPVSPSIAFLLGIAALTAIGFLLFSGAQGFHLDHKSFEALESDSEEACEAMRLMEENMLAKEWRDVAVLSGRELRRFDLFAMRVIKEREQALRTFNALNTPTAA